MLTHTYASSGTYTIKIKANCYRIVFGDNDFASMVYDCNSNWNALGKITNGNDMFYNCSGVVFSFTELPPKLIYGNYMFFNCQNAQLELTKLPIELTEGNEMFYRCYNAQLPLSSLPENLIYSHHMFYK